MAALVEGQQYGLSAQDKINCTKSLVFVKLTDSALKSIEEYVKNKADTISRPTIQFQNSNGVISLPHHGSKQNYGFTLSNVEADGPQGSFECLRQAGHRSLESLGCMQLKMHIHATEDSYENTRVKMAAVEKEQKKSCTKVIKPAGAHLGRKVKVVKVNRPGLVVSPMKFSPPTSSMINKNPVKSEAVRITNAYSVNSNVPVKKPEPVRPKLTHKNPELVRQPIRDRIIHILAVRPYKRPELLVRLMNEGIRDKDKNKVTSILPQISSLKGNIYYLANYSWNEVQDNWKFCTQEELEIIRKRKQQHANSSTESETPPNHQPNNSPIQKRIMNEVDTNGHVRNKKQRISHYKGDPQRSSYGALTSDVMTTTISKKMSYSPSPVLSNLNGISNDEDSSSQKSPASSCSDSYPSYNNKNTSSDFLSSSSLTNQKTGTRQDSTRSQSSSQGWANPDRPPPSWIKRESPEVESKSFVHSDNGKSQALSHSRSPDSNHSVKKEDKGACSKTATNGYVNNNSIKSSFSNQSSYVNHRSKVTSTTNGSCSNSPHSSCDSRDSMDYNDTGLHCPPLTTVSPTQCDSPEYEKEYFRIVSREQRTRYKANFNAEYGEYLCLHKKIVSISKKFTTLEGHLNNYKEGSKEFKIIKSQIIKEYRAYQEDRNYADALKKFNYLHNKLAYIKRLVTEYDTAHVTKS